MLDLLALLEMVVDVLDRDGRFIDENADGERESGVAVLRVSPIDSRMIEPSTASGIEVAMMIVERQLPRNNRIITLVSSATMMPSRATAAMAPRRSTDRRQSRFSTQPATGSVLLDLLLDAGDDIERRDRARLRTIISTDR